MLKPIKPHLKQSAHELSQVAKKAVAAKNASLNTKSSALGLTFLGLVGAAFVMPLVIALWLGRHLKDTYGLSSEWALIFIFGGLFLGILNSVYFIRREGLANNPFEDKLPRKGSK